MFQNIFCKPHLILILNIHKLLLSLLIIGIDLKLADLRQIRDPLVTNMIRYPICQQRVAVKKEPTLSDSVGLIIELLRHHLVEVLKLLILQDLCVKPCHTIYRIACSDCKVSHLHLSVIDNGHLADLLMIARILLLDLLDKAAVDLLDNLIHTGKQSGEQLNRPFLQSLGHNGMVGISTSLCGYLPCLIPLQMLLVKKNTHQLCHSDCRMGIVKLERCFLIKFADILMGLLILRNSSLNAGRDKEILLFQTKFLSCHMVIIWVENLYQKLSQVLLLYSFLVLSLVKRIQMERIHGLRIPDTQGVDHIVAIAHNRQITGNRTDALIPFLHKVISSLFIRFNIYITTKLYNLCVLRTAKFKGIAILKPLIRHLNLIAILDPLLKHSIVIADTAAISHVSQGRQGIQETCGQSSKTAVAKCCVRFLILNQVQITAQFLHGLFYFIIKGQIDQIISQGTAH